MSKDIDLTEILKNCPRGAKFYSYIFGDETYFQGFSLFGDKPISIVISGKKEEWQNFSLSRKGHPYNDECGECCIFPSREMRDWTKFTAPWYKKGKFDPKTLKPFDKVLISINGEWQCDFFSYMLSGDIFNKRCIGVGDINIVIPYNEETKHLLGTADEAPDFYRYWENSINNRRFDPKTLKLHDKVLVRDEFTYSWASAYFYYIKEDSDYPYMTTRSAYRYCIPYNNDTKHLDGRKEQAPDFYRYWED